MSSPSDRSTMRVWLRRLALLAFTALFIAAAIFWLRLSADEPEITLPTLQASAAAVDISTPASFPLIAQVETLPSLTPIPTITPTFAPGITPPPTPAATPTPPPTPTSIPQPTVGISDFQPDFATQVPAATPVEQIPLPGGVTNVLLLGSDALSTGEDQGSERTDSIIIVSINREEGTASMLSIPRDLYLYIPGWQDSRINTAFARGSSVDYPGGGTQLLRDTILYNFGIPIHYYAKIDFNGFEQIIDTVGGIEIVNSCPLEDWRLKEPGLDITVEENYMMYLLEPGVHQMDGFSALWYARSRRTTSDFDRGRRQQQILDALLSKGLELNLIPQIPSLWDAFQNTVETDMDLGKMLQLAAVAPTVRENGIQHLYFSQGELESVTLEENGAQVQILHPEIARQTLSMLYTVPTLNRSAKSPIFVEIYNRSGRADMARLAADNLAWFGFKPIITEENGPPAAATTLEYRRETLKGSYDWLVSWIFGLPRGAVELAPDTAESYQYKVVLGSDYNPCRNPLYAPRP